MRLLVAASLLLLLASLLASSSEGGTRARTAGIVDIMGSSGEWRDKLVAAVQQPGTTVRLAANVDMDLSGLGTVQFAQGVTLTSVKDPAPGKRVILPAAVSHRRRHGAPPRWARGSSRGRGRSHCSRSSASRTGL